MRQPAIRHLRASPMHRTDLAHPRAVVGTVRASEPAQARSAEPELVWRRSARGANDPAIDGVDEPASSDRSRFDAPRNQASSHAAGGAVAAEARAPVIARLDPALIDRLADDVIRRVERHIRIERERRGV